MAYEFRDISDSQELRRQAAHVLHATFARLGNTCWPDLTTATKEVDECLEVPNLCIGICDDGDLLGWVGLRPMYARTWELHPLVVQTDCQGRGIGILLMNQLEKVAREKGIMGIMLGSDDEHAQTSLSNVLFSQENIFREIESIRNVARHPFEFYRKCGYIIVGIVPNANGEGKPDIWMWKNISKSASCS